jgi:hypothetical protein
MYGFPWSATNETAWSRIHANPLGRTHLSRYMHICKVVSRLLTKGTAHYVPIEVLHQTLDARHAKLCATRQYRRDGWEEQCVSSRPLSHERKRNARLPSMAALFRATLSSSLISSNSVTMSDPNAMDPSESVDARPKAERVGCLGFQPQGQHGNYGRGEP